MGEDNKYSFVEIIYFHFHSHDQLFVSFFDRICQLRYFILKMNRVSLSDFLSNSTRIDRGSRKK